MNVTYQGVTVRSVNDSNSQTLFADVVKTFNGEDIDDGIYQTFNLEIEVSFPAHKVNVDNLIVTRVCLRMPHDEDYLILGLQDPNKLEIQNNYGFRKKLTEAVKFAMIGK